MSSITMVGPPAAAPGQCGRFPIDELRRRDLSVRLIEWVLDRPRLLGLAARLLRWPLARFRNIALVTSYDAVQGVLADDRAFPVPFGERFQDMDRTGTNFILGMPDDRTYRDIRAQVAKAFRFSDLPRLARHAEERAAALVEAAAPRGKIDAMAGLLTLVPIELVGEYYGIPIQDPEFPLWTMAMSAYAFAGPGSSDLSRQAALAGAKRVGDVVDAAVARAVAAGGDDTTILGRLVMARRAGVAILTDDVLRATMIGLITGFVPTNTKAGGQILGMLLRRPDMLAAAEAAAQAGDDDLLRRCLFEALRFSQALPGIFRHCAHERVLPGGQRVRPGMWVWASTQLAAFDATHVERPWRFNPARGEADSLGFGLGQHRCFGFALAGAQITATFRPLLLRGGLRRVPGEDGRPSSFASFPEHRLIAFGK